MGTTLTGKTPGGVDATFKWLLHTGNPTLASARRISTGDGLDTGLVVGAATIGVANASGFTATLDPSGLTAARTIALQDGSGTLAFLSDITAAIDALLGGAPGALDTLNELAAALGDDADFAATVTAALATKAALGGENTWSDSNSFASVEFRSSLSFTSTASFSYDPTAKNEHLAALGVRPGVDVQEHSSTLDTWSGIEPGTNVAEALAEATSGTGGFVRSSQPVMLTGDQSVAGVKTFSGASTVVQALRAADGTVGAPAIAFASDPGTGFYRSGAFTFDFVAAGSTRFRISGGTYLQNNTPEFNFSGDVRLFRDAANQLALRNGATGQTLRVYNNYTDASNYERGFFRWSSNVLEIGAEAAGTGTQRAMKLVSQATAPNQAASSGDALITRDLDAVERLWNLHRVISLPLYTSGGSAGGAGMIANQALGTSINAGTSNGTYARALLGPQTNHDPTTTGGVMSAGQKMTFAVFGEFVAGSTANGGRLRFLVGVGAGAPALADANALSAAGFGVEIEYDGSFAERIRLVRYNGSFASSTWVPFRAGYNRRAGFILEHVGDGNLRLYAAENGALNLGCPRPGSTAVATLSGGPTGALGGGYAALEAVAASASSAPSATTALRMKLREIILVLD